MNVGRRWMSRRGCRRVGVVVVMVVTRWVTRCFNWVVMVRVRRQSLDLFTKHSEAKEAAHYNHAELHKSQCSWTASITHFFVFLFSVSVLNKREVVRVGVFKSGDFIGVLGPVYQCFLLLKKKKNTDLMG